VVDSIDQIKLARCVSARKDTTKVVIVGGIVPEEIKYLGTS
jgi:hypothetical protein